MVVQVGSRDHAWSIAKKMLMESSAYREFLTSQLPALANLESAPDRDLRHFIDWQDIPVLTKTSFYSRFPLADLIPESNRGKIFSYTRSSGSSSSSSTVPLQQAPKGFFWPELKQAPDELARDFGFLLRQLIPESEDPSLLIVGLSLGSWAGGEQMSFAARLIGLHLPSAPTVYAPGNNHEEIIEAIQTHGDGFRRIAIACCPSAIFYLLRAAERRRLQLPLDKISFIVTGEPFAEEYRIELSRRVNVRRSGPIMQSLYSSADTGVLGVESAQLIQVRQKLLDERLGPRFAAMLGLEGSSIPSFFHLNVRDRFIEVIDGRLVLTLWQGLPLVRYDLEDRVQIFSWSEISDAMIACSADSRERKLWRLLQTYEMPEVIAVYGRHSGCLYLCGSNIFDNMLEEALLSSQLLKRQITGHFMVCIGLSPSGQQQLHWYIEALEAEDSLNSSSQLHQDLCVELSSALGRLQPEFKDDYERFYALSEESSELIFQFHFLPAGEIQKHPSYMNSVGKRKIIQDRTPF